MRDGTAWLSPGVAVLCVAAFTWFAYRPSGTSQLLTMCLCPVGLVIAVVVPFVLKRYRRRALVASLAIVASPFVGFLVGHAIRRADFELRVRPRYEQFIARIERGEIRVDDDTPSIPPPPALEDITYGVQASRDEDARLCVIFFWGGGFPVRHSVYLHAAPGSCARERRRFRFTEIGTSWFAGSD